MALITFDEVRLGVKELPDDGGVILLFEDQDDGNRYAVPVAKADAVEYAEQIKRKALGIQTARADEMPGGNQ